LDKTAPQRPEGSARIDDQVIGKVGIALEAMLGEAHMTVGELRALGTDDVVTLDLPLNGSLRLLLNGVLVARGELVAVGDKFGVRLTELGQ